MADIFVNHSGDNTTGADEATAFNDLQTAINNAVSNDRICVKIDGTYYTGGVGITFPVSASYSSNQWIKVEAYIDTPGDCNRGQVNYGQRALFDGGAVSNLFTVDRSGIWIGNICCTNCSKAFYISYNSYVYNMTFSNCGTLADVDWAFEGGHYSYNNGLWVEDGYYQSGAKFYGKYNVIENAIFKADKNFDLIWAVRSDFYNCVLINSYAGTGPLSPGYRSPISSSGGFLNVRNCYLEGSDGIASTSSSLALVEYNNIFNCHSSTNPIYNRGSFIVSDYSATNKSAWGINGHLTDGSGRINNLDLSEHYEDILNYDFTLKKDSPLRTAGWGGVSGLNMPNLLNKPPYPAHIGPNGVSIIKQPKRIFTQGG